MGNLKFLALFGSSILLMVFGACSSGPLDSNLTNKTQPAATLTCTASPVKGLVNSGAAATINVSAQGGTSPYSIAASGTSLGVSSFTETTTLSRTYTNSGSNSVVQSDSVNVTDANGNAATCNFSIVIASAPTASAPLFCQLVVTSGSAITGQNVDFLTVASGGAGSYSFSNFVAGAYGTPTPGLSPNPTASSNTAIATYSSAGTPSASVTVTDGSGTSYSCGVSFPVTAAPASAPLTCQLAVTSGPVAGGQNVDFLATASGGAGSYKFSDFVPGKNGTVVTALTSGSPSNQSTAVAIYSGLGNPVASVTVTDSANATYACTTTFSVAAPAGSPAPTISAVGLGCDNMQCIWITGVGFTTDCTVNLFTPNWQPVPGTNSNLIATLTGNQVVCSDTVITFPIPAAIYAAYSAINLDVVDGWGVWTPPVSIIIKP